MRITLFPHISNIRRKVNHYRYKEHLLYILLTEQKKIFKKHNVEKCPAILKTQLLFFIRLLGQGKFFAPKVKNLGNEGLESFAITEFLFLSLSHFWFLSQFFFLRSRLRRFI